MSIDFTEPTALYIQIAKHIKSQIDTSVLNPGDQLESHQVLAKKYNVSLITVKKALNDLIHKNYLFSRVGKGTYVAERPKEIDFSEDITIGLVLRDLESPFFARIVESVEKQASKTGCNLLISTSSNSREKESKQINKYLKLGVSGLILTSITNETHISDVVRNLHKDNFPYVVVAFTEDEDINYIGVDHELGACLATEHLIRLGYKNIGYINCESGYKLGEVRKKGFLEALENHGYAYNENFHYRLRQRGDWHDYESGYEIALDYIKQSERPDALFIYNDLAALGFEKGILESGLSIPQDVAIVGFDNIKRGVVAPVPLTTIQQPVNGVGRLAIEMILKKIKGELLKNRIVLKPTLVIRDSCGAKIRSENLKNTLSTTLEFIDQE